MAQTLISQLKVTSCLQKKEIMRSQKKLFLSLEFQILFIHTQCDTDWNVTLYGHYGEQYEGSSKKPMKRSNHTVQQSHLDIYQRTGYPYIQETSTSPYLLQHYL
nr:uncharacterized protein LOC102136046 isoform X2 [Macaca fascicularis]